ncbi:uncharacterized protein METZ01_LOCUS153550, partial [marine metagenome]
MSKRSPPALGGLGTYLYSRSNRNEGLAVSPAVSQD